MVGRQRHPVMNAHLLPVPATACLSKKLVKLVKSDGTVTVQKEIGR